MFLKAGADLELGASTPLMEASQEGHLELVRYLLEARADVNATTGERTRLRVAQMYKAVVTFRLWVLCGCRDLSHIKKINGLDAINTGSVTVQMS
jgi:ankyrin repeat protein